MGFSLASGLLLFALLLLMEASCPVTLGHDAFLSDLLSVLDSLILNKNILTPFGFLVVRFSVRVVCFSLCSDAF